MVGDKFFKTLLEAQKHDLMEIVKAGMPANENLSPEQCKEWELVQDDVVNLMVNYATPIVDILTTTPTSRAKARKNNGGEKPKAKKKKITAATVPEA